MPGRIEILQGGRAVAALAVVAFHANLYVATAGPLSLGRFGVDFFFVLSGFIIYHVGAGPDFRLRRYARSRATRIFVPYLPLGVAAALAYVALGKADWGWWSTLTLLPGEGRTALSVAWTLQREVAFYIVAAVLFMSGKPLHGALLWVALIMLRSFGTEPLSAVEAVFLAPQNIEFVVGMFAAAAFGPRWLAAIRTPSLLSRIGDASYAIYLAHLPVMAVLWRMGAPYLVLVAAAVAGGLAYHRWFEKPVLEWAKRYRLPSLTQVPGVPETVQRQPLGEPTDGKLL